MPGATRLKREQAFHDRQAAERRRTFDRHPERLHFSDDDYLDHESWIRPAFAALGSVAGLRVLDFGCGHGMASVVLARRGAHVVGFDLSGGYLAEARRRAEANGVQVTWVQADGERLPFANGSFDRVWGNAVLHHLAIDKASAELRRVLAPQGRAVFCEPWGESALVRLARRYWPYGGKQRTDDEEPLRETELAVLRQFFPRVKATGHQLLGAASRLLGMKRWLRACDENLLRCFPSLTRYCRYVVLELSGAAEAS